MKILLLMPLVSGCTAGAVISGFHTAYNDCGPVDDPIITIDLGLTDPVCQDISLVDGLMRISIYSQNIGFGDSFTIGQDMSAVWCVDEICESVANGNVEITAFEDGIAVSGFYELTLEGGTTFAGDLAAEWCDLEEVICG